MLEGDLKFIRNSLRKGRRRMEKDACLPLFNCTCHGPFCLSPSPRAQAKEDHLTRHLLVIKSKRISVNLY